MPHELILTAAFLTGLFGSIHCVGMCGGIVGALTLGLPPHARQHYHQLLPYLITYNIGRLTSYTLAGTIAGFLSQQLITSTSTLHSLWMWFAGILTIMLGLYIGAWWQKISIIERLGTYLWRYIQPLSKHFLPIKTPLHALAIGLIWGWIPCGMVYTALIVFAFSAGSGWQGGLTMLLFGIGTLPMLLVMGATATWLMQFTRKPLIRQSAGSLLIIIGILTLPILSQHGLLIGIGELCNIPLGIK